MDFTGDPDDPRRPLGVEAPVRTSRRASVAKVAGGLALAAALIAGVAAARRDVGGGMPFAVATIEDAPKPVAVVSVTGAQRNRNIEAIRGALGEEAFKRLGRNCIQTPFSKRD